VKKIVIIVVLVASAVGVYLFLAPAGNENPAPKYVTVPVERGALTAEVNCTGTLKPLVEVLVGSQVSGTIKELHADFETQVKKGELIALIDPAMFGAKVAQAEADVEAAKASLAKSAVTLTDELRNLKRQTQLLARNSISQSEFDTAQTKADAARAQETVDRARVIQAKAKLQEAKLQLDYTRIIAPVNGVVTSRSVDAGQTVAASFQAPVLFKIAEDLTRMQVNANVDEADIGRVTVGQKAVFTVPAFPDLTFAAAVTQIRNEPQIEQNVVTYNVVLDVDNKGLKLRPGMTANVRILLSRLDDVLMLPDQAFRFVPSLKSSNGRPAPEPPALKAGERRVWKLDGNGRITPAIVRAGVTGTEKVQVLSDKLKAGDRVVVAVKSTGKKARRRGMRFGF
jgi:HlyD family secretion protein